MSRIYSFGILALIGCQGETVIEKQANSAPSILIVSHSTDAVIQEGYTEVFRASVSDDDNEFSELLIAWYVGERLVCDWEIASPSGDSSCEILFLPDDYNVIAEVRDTQGTGGRAEIEVSVTPTQAPEIEILSPQGNHAFYANQLIEFSAIISDAEDEAEDLEVLWTSSIDGELLLDTRPDSEGQILDYVYLSEGEHAIELQVEDTSGKVSNEHVILQVGAENIVPTCEITTPEDLSAVVVGDSVLFRGIVGDANIAANQLSTIWNSDKDGDLGAGTINSSGEVTFTYSALSADSHVISLIVEDEVGEQCQDTLLLYVGTPPAAVIAQPLDGEVYSVGDSIVFQGALSDQEDQPNEIAVVWDSTIDGELMAGSANSQGISQFSTANLTAGMHSISLTATDTTGLVADDLITFRVNTPPTAPSIILSPDPIYSTQTLQVMASGSVDGDGHNVSYSYLWLENAIVTSVAGSSVPAAELDVGEVWTVRVTPNDGFVDGAYSEASITIANSVPIVSSVQISSSSGSAIYNDSVLSCTAIIFDADETLSPSYSWDIDGVLVSSAVVDLSSYSLLPGDSVSCTASATDSYGVTASSTASENIDNRSPAINSVSIAPSSALSNSLLSCSVSAVDLDGESLSSSFEWFHSGIIVGTGAELQLDNTMVSPGTNIECSVLVEDVAGATAQDSGTTTIQNSNPTLSAVILAPAEPSLNDTLTCQSAVADIDVGSPSLGFAFLNQTTGQSYSASTSSSASATLVLSATNAVYEDIIVCEVTASDIDGGSATDYSSVTIVNTSPEFTQEAEITPNTGVQNGSDLECLATATDPDDGVASLSYIWQAQGVQVSIGSSWTVDQVDAVVGDSITCTAIAIDFEGNISTSTSAAVLVKNLIPEISSVMLSSLTPDTETVLSTSILSSDGDGDVLTFHYEWHVLDASSGGQDIIVATGSGSSFASLSGVNAFDRDDEVFVLVTPNDGLDDGLAVTSDQAIVQNTAPTEAGLSMTSTAFPDEPVAAEDDLICSIDSISSDLDIDSITYTYEWYDGDALLQQTTSNTTILDDTFLAAGVTMGTWNCEVTASDGTNVGTTAITTIDVIGRESCLDYANSGFTVDGVYTILRSDGISYDAYCDMTIENGGWSRIVGTNSTRHDWGQTSAAIVSSYVGASDLVGVAEAFEKLQEFSEVMIKKTSNTYSGEYAAYNLVETISGQSVMDILQYCSAQPRAYNNDTAWDGARVVGYTSHYSGTQYAGNLLMGTNAGASAPDYFFMCGVNESSDNDQSVLAFTDNPGTSNWWGDSWRGDHQNGAMWSFWNGDYHYSGTYHIGNGYAQGYAGYKTYSATNTGTYEVYIR